MYKTEKAIISIILTLIMLITGFPMEPLSEGKGVVLAATAQTYKLGDNVNGVLTADGTLTISGTGAMYDYDNYEDEQKSPVYNESAVRKVIIQDGITYVGTYTFEKCYYLQEVKIAGSVKEIGRRAFVWDNGIKTVELGYGIETIGYFAFGRCSGLTSINFPDSIKTIEGAAFYGCFELTNIKLPPQLEKLESNTFGGCVKIESLEIPASVTEMGSSVFGACANIMGDKEYTLTSVYVNENNKSFKSIDGVVYSKDEKKIVWYPDGRKDTSYSVKNGVEIIGEWAFENAFIQEIALPDTVSRFEEAAFAGAYKLNKINMPASLAYIGNCAFEACWELDNIVIPKSVTYIGYHAFAKCLSLKNITIYDTVKYVQEAIINDGTISDYIFYGCSEDLNVHLYKGSVIDEYMNNYDLGKREYLSPKPAMNVEYRTEEQIRNYIKSHPIDMNYNDTYVEKPILQAPYTAGSLSLGTLNNGLNTVNVIRYIAGLNGTVMLKSEYTDLAQAGAMMIGINKYLTHYPSQPEGMSDELYKTAYNGSMNSNIALGYSNLSQSIIKGYMNDGDNSNIAKVGHRRWILNPFMQYTGFGEADYTTVAYNGVGFVNVNRKGFAMYASDESNVSQQYGVAWPAQTMPVEYFGADYPWSISLGNTIDETGLKVKLTNVNTKKVWNFSAASSDGEFYVNNSGYGQTGCIIFRPDNIVKYSDGDVYKVEITGLKAAAFEDSFTYTVTFFNLEPVVYGDINNDGTIDTQDAVLIKKYLAGYKGLDISLDACDINADGDITSADAVLLLKHLAGYNVILGK